MEKNEERPGSGPEEEQRPEETGWPQEPAEIEAWWTETGAPAPVEDRPIRSRGYIRTAAISVGVLFLGAALFVSGFWTHSLADDDIDLTPVEDRLLALEGQVSDVDDRTAGIEDILSAAVVSADGGNQPAANPAAATSSASSDDPSFGPEDAAVVIVAFSDFQCPYCSSFSAATLPSIEEAYGDKVRFIFRDYPLHAIHPSAQKAAEAGQCAHEQGFFWQYHDLLFANQNTLAVPDLKRFADQIGADTAQFYDCLDSGKYSEEVLLDLQDGQTAGITGTPGFIINGLLMKGAQPFEVFQQVIDQMLAEE
jgi:protein-disulfide isomerase